MLLMDRNLLEHVHNSFLSCPGLSCWTLSTVRGSMFCFNEKKKKKAKRIDCADFLIIYTFLFFSSLSGSTAAAATKVSRCTYGMPKTERSDSKSDSFSNRVNVQPD